LGGHPVGEFGGAGGDGGAVVAVASASRVGLHFERCQAGGGLDDGEFAKGFGPGGGRSPPLPYGRLPHGSGRFGSGLSLGQGAQMLYTSGTTGQPKGVVLTHGNLAAQVHALVTAWGWQGGDRLLHVLPLHHIHGIVNALLCPLAVGARCEMLPKFEVEAVWERLGSGDISVLMGVPTMYRRLVDFWEDQSGDRQAAWRAGCQGLRLAVSGSAALPVSVLTRWQEITGIGLLERYGMTEIGMALSQPLLGERVPGTVGQPLPGVTVRVVDEAGQPVAAGEPGELEVQGPSVFREYWQRPEATAAAFRDGWFRTGDLVVARDGAYRIWGRRSVDLIKTGGYKVSALEIEEVLRTHPVIADCAVVGLPDAEWGERVAVAVVLKAPLTLEALRVWGKTQIAPYKVPSRWVVLPELPRNALGKVTKPAIAARFALP
ncbi:MAG: AMP-binding protein, partial [Oscillatoriales cyanobacterium SM2_1_8]|nr:AMP-binding protein [Oscillatoriales cyanobacterium SM2_1_8]